jgi:hypothetical protein
VAETRESGVRVAFVGPCATGKSTLVRRLRAAGVDARMPAQEHSGVADMWRKLVKPDLLVALDASNEALRARRPEVDLNDDFLSVERQRLAHALAHADLRLDTTALDAEQVYETIVGWLRGRGVEVNSP